MAGNRDLEKEVSELKAELKRLTDGVERNAWGNPHDFAYKALSAVELIRDYYGGGAKTVEKIQEIAEILRVTAAGRVSYPQAGAAFIYGLADLIQGVYLDNRYHLEVHGHAQRSQIEELRKSQELSKRNG